MAKKCTFSLKWAPLAPRAKYSDKRNRFRRPPGARMAQKCTFSQKVHFFAISAPGGRQKHRRLSLYLESAKKVRKYSMGHLLFAFCPFWRPRIGKTRVHVVNLHDGDFCDDFCEIFSFSEKCVSETGFFIDVYGVFAKNQKVISRKIYFCENSRKIY